MDPKRKAEILNDPYFQTIKQVIYCDIHKSDFVDFNTKEILLTYKDAESILTFEKNSSFFKDCMRIIHAQNKRYNNLLKRIIYYMNSGSCYFITLTFRNDVLDNVSELTRRKYVRRFLKSLDACYICNIDFGDQTEREHYHGVVLIDDPELIKKWSYGWSDFRKIRDNKQDLNRISNYILKITNHFVKESTKKNYCIYSRDKIKFGANNNCIKSDPEYIQLVLGDPFTNYK